MRNRQVGLCKTPGRMTGAATGNQGGPRVSLPSSCLCASMQRKEVGRGLCDAKVKTDAFTEHTLRHYLYTIAARDYCSSCRSNFGGAQSSCGGLSFEVDTHTGRMASTRRLSFITLPVRNPLSVDEAMPYVLRPLPVPVETVLELRALRTLLDLVTAAGTAGTGRASRADSGLAEPYSGGRIWGAPAVSGCEVGTLGGWLVLRASLICTS